MVAPKRDFDWNEEIVVEGDYSELQRQLNELTQQAEAFSGVFATLTADELESLSSFADDFNGEMSRVLAFVSQYVASEPLGELRINTREEKIEALEKISLSPKGLGLTEEQLAHALCTRGEWKRLFVAWNKARVRGVAGRPQEPKTAQIFNKWIAIGRPSTTTQDLAKEVYGRIFTTAGPTEKKKMVDRCRAAVLREQRKRD